MSDLAANQQWQDRQGIWYEMRHHGLRRKGKPWPGAADLHYPLADTMIDKFKPFYVQQVFSGELLAQFRSLRSQDMDLTEAAGQWFDYHLKQRSNFEMEVLPVIDSMLMNGKGIMKVLWNADERKLEFDAIDPLYLIVPVQTEELARADRIVHVMHYSEDAFRRNPRFKADETLVRQLKTPSDNGVVAVTESGQLRKQLKVVREELTMSRSNQIIVWEVYVRNQKGWEVRCFSPSAPEVNLRTPFQLTYQHGLPPFVEFDFEVKEKGYYSSRGVCERIAAFEASLCKLWNEKHDCMTLFNRPIYMPREGELPNGINYRMHPGQIMPRPLEALKQGEPPVSFDQEMANTRMVAEQLMGVPDFGVGQSQNNSKPRTAMEVGFLSQLMGQNVELRGRVFRHSLGKVLRQAWALLVQFDRDQLEYFFRGEHLQVDQQALHEGYEILPNGSADHWNRQYVMAKSVSRYEMLRDNPHVNLEELTKSVLEADDPRLVSRLLQTSEARALDQSEDQAIEIAIMKQGFAAQVKESDDHEVHLNTLLGKMEQIIVTGEENSEQVFQLLVTHGYDHFEFLKKMNLKVAEDIRPRVEAIAQGLLQKQRYESQDRELMLREEQLKQLEEASLARAAQQMVSAAQPQEPSAGK